MNLRRFQFVSLAITLTIFGAVNLITMLAVPGMHVAWLWLPSIVAAVAVLVGFPYAIAFFEKQQERIENQVRELEALHAMDTSIVSEMELDRVLDVAVQRVMGTVDAVAGGIVLLDPANDTEVAIHVCTPDHQAEDAESFARLLRRGEADRSDPVWNAAIYPLRGSASDAEPITGFLAAARARPSRPFGNADLARMKALAGTVTIAIRNAYALRAAHQAALVIQEGEKVRADLARERRIAKALTEGLLPEIAPKIGSFHFSKSYVAQSDEAEVGGDIYDLFPLGSDRWGVVIADVSGKGLAAAQKTAMVKYSLRSYAREHGSPAAVLTRLNDTLSDEDQMTGFVTLFYGVLDRQQCRLTYASAGHEPPIVRRATGEFDLLSPTGMVLGAMRDMPYEDDEVSLHPGDGLLLYTDGLTEARSAADGEFLMIEGVQKLLAELTDTPAAEVAHALWKRVETYTGGHQLDDTALLWVCNVCE